MKRSIYFLLLISILFYGCSKKREQIGDINYSLNDKCSSYYKYSDDYKTCIKIRTTNYYIKLLEMEANQLIEEMK